MDNNRIELNVASVSVPSLPTQLEGYNILHISDLFGKNFGNDQEDIIKALSNSKFGAIVFTGNFADANNDVSAFVSLINALKEYGKSFYYIIGDKDPPLMSTIESEYKFNAVYDELDQAGAIYLDVPVRLTQSKSRSIWLMPQDILTTDPDFSINQLESSMLAFIKQNTPEAQKALAECRFQINRFQRIKEAKAEMEQDDIVIVAAHYPKDEDSMRDLAGADLVLCGHMLGAQFCLPGGMPFLSIDEKIDFFPKKEDVEGLSLINAVPQYISRGLGARGPIPIRLFNTPQITLIRLTARVQ
jgi:predicted MPP superfamily phosphohydrolase